MTVAKKAWTKPVLTEADMSLEVTRYLPSILDKPADQARK